MLRPIMDIPDRHLTQGNETHDDDMRNPRMTARRRASSVSEMRYEMYTRMLKSLPESAYVREKMISDGFSETEINDFFGLDSTNPTGLPHGLSNSGVGGKGGLNTDKYKKMLRLLPSSHVREKMLEVGFPDNEIDDMIGPYDPNAPSSTIVTSPMKAKPVDPKYEKYFKMMKHLPEDAVRQKMKMESLSDDDIEEFFKQLLDVAVATAQGATIEAVDPKYEKFLTMAKMLPEGAIRQKMKMENITDTEADHFFNKVLPDFKNGTSSSSSSSASPTKVAEPIPDKFEKYRIQQKRLPEPAVRRNMTTDGLSADEIEVFFNGGTATNSSPVKAGTAAVGAALGAAFAAGGNGLKKSVVAEPEKPPEGMIVKEVVQPNKKMKGIFIFSFFIIYIFVLITNLQYI